jgi:hypothetical protein
VRPCPVDVDALDADAIRGIDDLSIAADCLSRQSERVFSSKGQGNVVWVRRRSLPR